MKRHPWIVAMAVALACNSTPVETSTSSTLLAGDGTQLAYTIDFPRGTGPFPAVVLVHGSGRVTRADHAGLSAQFTAHGWAVLRYDKRGVGQSEGAYSGVSVANSDTLIRLLGSDAAAAFRTLAQSARVNPRRIGYAGGSQAGWIIPVAIGATPGAALAVILSGPTVSVGLEIYYSDLVENSSGSLDDAYDQLGSFTGQHGFDPRAYLSATTPTLWLFGADDRSIPTRVCVEILGTIPSSASTVRVYPGLGHALSGNIWPDIYDFLDRINTPGSR